MGNTSNSVVSTLQKHNTVDTANKLGTGLGVVFFIKTLHDSSENSGDWKARQEELIQRLADMTQKELDENRATMIADYNIYMKLARRKSEEFHDYYTSSATIREKLLEAMDFLVQQVEADNGQDIISS